MYKYKKQSIEILDNIVDRVLTVSYLSIFYLPSYFIKNIKFPLTILFREENKGSFTNRV